MPRTVHRITPPLLALVSALALAACAQGDDGVMPRGGDGGLPLDAGAVDSGPAAGADAAACPPSAECVPSATETAGPCGDCGTLVRTCTASCMWGTAVCTDEGVCSPGEMETDTEACPGDCGMTRTRSRVCDMTCQYGDYGEFSTCTACGPSCGDSACNGTETCETCADCNNDHLTGEGETGDSCAGVPEETWRCVYSNRWEEMTSQFCRDGEWGIFHRNPRDCESCVCGYSTACRQEGL